MQLFSLIAATVLLLAFGDAKKSPFQFYDLKTKLSGPCDLTTGPDGAIWGQGFLSNIIFRIDPDTGKLEEFTIPYKRAPIVDLPTFGLGILKNRTAFACVVQPGEDGNVYVATGIRNEFAFINPKTKKISVFDTGNPLGNLEPFNDAYRGPNGMFFSQTTQGVMTQFDYKTHKFTTYHPPTPNSGPLGVYYASDGAIWFTEILGQKIGRLNITTGDITEHPVSLPLLATPSVMRAETTNAQGEKFLWFTAIVGNGVGSINMKTFETKAYEYPLPLSAPSEDTVDSKGRVWYSTLNTNTLNRLDPNTGVLKRITLPGTLLPGPGGFPPAVSVAIHYGPGNKIWFTELSKNLVGSYQLYD